MPVSYDRETYSLLELLTVSEVAKALHVHPNTVRNWSDNGLLKSYRLGQRRDRRFNLKDVNKLLKSKRI